jgi:hypothetical protein
MSSVWAAVIADEAAMSICGGTACASSSEMVATFTRGLYDIVEALEKVQKNV